MKAIVSISEMARMVGLSRARFYQLIGSTFPWPLYHVASRRPFYNEELQRVCLGLEVRRRNCGVDGRPVMFYSRRITTSTPTRRPKPKDRPKNQDPMVGAMKSLGLVVTASQVAIAAKELFPKGVGQVEPGELLRAMFLHLQRQVQSNQPGR